MKQPNTNDTPMTKPFSSNPKLADWVPSEQQIQTITAARDIWDWDENICSAGNIYIARLRHKEKG